jgi:uncharacterized protein
MSLLIKEYLQRYTKVTEKTTLTKQQARRFMLAHQSLYPPYDLKGKAGILEFIRRVGCIQFDPLNIVGHNPELLLQARISGFKPSILQELLYSDRTLLDGWDKMMSIYCTEDWPYFQRQRQAALDDLGNAYRPVTPFLPMVRKEIEERGPLSSIELDFDQRVNWPWGPTRLSRAALESMYFWGELIIHHKIHTRKVYDFATRHIPESILKSCDPNISLEQYHDWHVQRRIGGVGLLWGRSGDAWISIPGVKSKERGEVIKRLLLEERISEIYIEGMTSPFYMRNIDKPRLENAVFSDEQKPKAAILAPLDNLLWDRRLVKELFDFDYRWEVYKPVVERDFGYYVLPVLYGDRFIARFEPGRDKKNGALIIKNWWWEPDIHPTKKMYSSLNLCFRHFAEYLGAKEIKADSELNRFIHD